MTFNIGVQQGGAANSSLKPPKEDIHSIMTCTQIASNLDLTFLQYIKQKTSILTLTGSDDAAQLQY